MVARTLGRSGFGRLGCLLWLLVLTVLFYVGSHFGRPWFRYYQFKDEMETAASFGDALSDGEIRARLQARADSLELPLDARQITIQRQNDRIVISSAYNEVVYLALRPPVVLRFRPTAQGPL